MMAARRVTAPARTKGRAPSEPVIRAGEFRAELGVVQARAKAAGTVGFGCPPLSAWPHHVIVSIPAGRGGDIRIREDFGILEDSERGLATERCAVPRGRWNAMADAAKTELNTRLREKGLATGRWQPGDNRVERVLGTELMTLAWAVISADEASVPAVVTSWVALTSSERLWLAGRVLMAPSDGVRRGLALLLSATPAEAPVKTSPAPKSTGGLPLFDLD
ncbi:DUF3780 domain-containing protein [Roseomonas nepalensis]|uniref:DUF3780 domain-containing protein n=1 Tax=Muricoccus nepalensis TaxID=1854500 RepID=A0A502G2L8_9PROT|nr:DUF3780 domain-containing protein [Roseomonas nepalensis]TPG55476.1 DUF3780 domain-containing protein [Roseomonas nepalensis]